MKIVIVSIGKEKDEISTDIIKHFEIRVLRYLPLEWMYIAHDSTKEKEGEKILSYLKKEDYVVLLDEKGKDMKSEALAELVENRMVDSVKRMVFVIGGAYGVSKAIEERANYVWKLSSLVFPHMLVRVILVEQLYRAMTILKGEKYHHE
ncbi:MAG: 23S rRNA (pseudouridine(1915)-N(3))-methyltransferase RlmH [Candidatus Pacebacteria bacterium]|nr:23S rRNA (pseudouridine(1915)-N(3))-methyltransferase RlmH [Candidatus Paceibacterota bacterium]MBP9866849.1 23S rRNA (pseudouridine(1915)-N(3))-methyltransferase RlmH [Candidatus Paceibacterota bacterium]